MADNALLKPLKILIRDCTSHNYNGKTIDQKPVGGIPIVTTRLAEALAEFGCDVTVQNNTNTEIWEKNVRWINRSDKTAFKSRPDIIIVNNDVNIFNEYKHFIEQGSVPVIWLHNLFTWKRLFKKRRVGSLLKWRPHAVFLSDYQLKACSKLMPFRSRTIIPHGVDDRFFEYQKNVALNKKRPQVLFLSKAFRGLGNVIDIWKDFVFPHNQEAVLKAFVGKENIKKLGFKEKDLKALNIIINDRVSQEVLMQESVRSMGLIYPGHKDETFCNVAAEASVLGVPIITQGVGSLSERVSHGENGYIAKEKIDLGNYILEVLSDLENQKNFTKKSMDFSQNYQWKKVIPKWLALFKSI